MLNIRNEIWRRLKTDHNIDLKTTIYDVACLEHEVEGETVGIATVMAAEASCEEVETAVLFLAATGEKLQHRTTHNFEREITEIFKCIKWVLFGLLKV